MRDEEASIDEDLLLDDLLFVGLHDCSHLSRYSRGAARHREVRPAPSASAGQRELLLRVVRGVRAASARVCV
jgi:hypothetical protein